MNKNKLMRVISVFTVTTIVGIGGFFNSAINRSVKVYANTEPIKTYTSVRLGGLNRYSTAIKIAEEITTEKLDAVVLASASNFTDALSGSVLGAKYNAPILLIDMNESNNIETINYIKANLKTEGKLYLLGGTGVVPDSVVKSLQSVGYNNFERLGGIDRYETNLLINNELGVISGTSIIVASSTVFADSLSVSSIAGVNQMPIYLTDSSITAETLSSIKAVAPASIYIVGGTGAVSSEVENQLKTIGNVVRIGGENRYETSIKIAKFFNQDTTVGVITSGYDFPDALAGSILASINNAPILLVDTESTTQKTYFDTTKVTKLYTLGGTGAVSENVEDKFTNPKSIILDVGLVKQFPEYYNGCEATSLSMLLNYAGAKVDKATVVSKIKMDTTPIKYNSGGRIISWGNPKVGFVGDIIGNRPGYSIDPVALAPTINVFLPGKALDLTECDYKVIESTILSGRPVVAWITENFVNPTFSQSWTSNGEVVMADFSQHAVLLTGVNEDALYYNDPLTGVKNARVDKSTFQRIWTKMGKKALSYYN